MLALDNHLTLDPSDQHIHLVIPCPEIAKASLRQWRNSVMRRFLLMKRQMAFKTVLEAFLYVWIHRMGETNEWQDDVAWTRAISHPSHEMRSLWKSDASSRSA